MKKKQKTAAITARSASLLVNRALRKIEEVKWIEFSATEAVDYAGTAHHDITAIAQGSTVNTRVGDRMRFKSAHITMTVIPGDAVNVFRCIVYQWHPLSTGAAPVPSSVLTHTSDAYAAISPYTVNNENDYSILYDKTWNLNAYDMAQKTINIWIKSGKFLKRDIHYQTGSSTVHKNGIYLLLISDSSAAAHPQAIWHVRTRWADS